MTDLALWLSCSARLQLLAAAFHVARMGSLQKRTNLDVILQQGQQLVTHPVAIFRHQQAQKWRHGIVDRAVDESIVRKLVRHDSTKKIAPFRSPRSLVDDGADYNAPRSGCPVFVFIPTSSDRAVFGMALQH